GVDHVAREGELGGAAPADHTRQEIRPAVARNDAELDEALGKERRFPGDADIAHAGKVAARADCRAIDGGDGRHFEVIEGIGDFLDAEAVGIADFRRPPCEQPFLVAHMLDVAPGGEGLARSRQNDTADAVVLVDPIRSLDKGGEEFISGKGIALLGPVDGEGYNSLILFVYEFVCHDGTSYLIGRKIESGKIAPRDGNRRSAALDFPRKAENSVSLRGRSSKI